MPTAARSGAPGAWLLACVSVLGASDAAQADTHEHVIGHIAELLAERYVDADRGRQLAAQLATAAQEGRFDSSSDPGQFAAALTDFLKPHDGHLVVRYSSDPPDGSGPVEAPNGESWREQSRRQNFGFRRLEVWPGNVGYLDLRSFDDPALGGETAAAAMRFLAAADAIIIDLRENGGGSPGMVQLLCSYFLGESGPVLLNNLYSREGDVTHQFWTLPVVPGERLPDVPLYVLTSGRTGSAAEEFAYNLQTQQRARLIGDRTAGVANPGDLFGLPDNFAIFVPTGRAINPVTGDNWEGKGVQPHREVAALVADRVAYEEALEKLAANAKTSTRQREIAWAQEALRARDSLLTLSDRERLPYVGRYGTRQILEQSGELRYVLQRRPHRALVPLARDRFMLAGVEDRRIEFERDASGNVVRLVELLFDGSRSAHPRQ